jgi:hypothetical protein
MKKKITKESLRRAFRTFLQTAIAYIAVNISVVDFTAGNDVVKSALMGLIVSAIAAGIAAIMNMEPKELEATVEEIVDRVVDALDEDVK